ncbi:MAG: ATP-dependent DNA helicase RecQ [uncultured Acidimicrobiales bacterium]|uniref:ATP-dependent DNA helicase RecQ n=1 Tax=uncultured Acidimicrobiales bacterium TaxID=310071 RepID=A0A6J4HCS9_9ACTN|nr:MAG: ATP-dependent DNA helicase RecQ [uncultured Acidimicrobiales bacterium]
MVEGSVDGYRAPVPTPTEAPGTHPDPAASAPEDPAERIRSAATELLGLDELRPGQAEAAVAVVSGRDTLAVMPTGSGKSAVYQVAAALLEGPTVVVSPLIALQKDQVEAIAAQEVGLAAAANSTISTSEREWIFDAVASGGLEFLFLSPEQLAREDTVSRLAEAEPSLFVVDEAHCISEWGHDFRTDYLRLAAAAEAVGRPPILALTATASPVVRDEIVERLRMRDPEVVVRGFDRPNLRIEVETHHRERDKLDALVGHVGRLEGTGIVYVATRKAAEEVASALVERTGRRVGHYHGGMRAADRRAAQDAFMEGEVEVVVATTAFGMGIDKADVRFVIHHDVPESVDAWYQEVGRAGRDGEPAVAILLWRPEDLGLRSFFAGGGTVGRDELERVAAMAAVAGGSVSAEDLGGEARLAPTRLAMALARLEEVGAVTTGVDGSVVVPEDAPRPEVAAEEADHDQAARRQVERTRLDMVRAFAETRSCRRRFVLTYFGEDAPERCGSCDSCDRPPDPDDAAHGPGTDRWPEQSRVRHDAWGEGLILRHEGDAIVVLFDDAGYRTLSIELVEQGGLLERL